MSRGEARWGGGDIKTEMDDAVAMLTEAADQSHVDAQRTLAAVYNNGWANGRPDYTRALFYSEKAAEQGDTLSQYMVAMIYQFGRDNVTQSPEKAHPWFVKAAESGDRESQHQVGKNYLTG